MKPILLSIFILLSAVASASAQQGRCSGGNGEWIPCVRVEMWNYDYLRLYGNEGTFKEGYMYGRIDDPTKHIILQIRVKDINFQTQDGFDALYLSKEKFYVYELTSEILG